MIRKDQLAKRFSDDENYDMIADLYRFVCIDTSEEVRNGGKASAIFCINPNDAFSKPLQECQRCVAMVTWENKKCTIVCYPYTRK